MKLAGLALGALTSLIIIASIYLGVWVMLVGGIVDIIDQIKAESTDSLTVALAIVKILLCELPLIVGFWSGFIGYGFTVALLFGKK